MVFILFSEPDGKENGQQSVNARQKYVHLDAIASYAQWKQDWEANAVLDEANTATNDEKANKVTNVH